jgi:hypothetical protein
LLAVTHTTLRDDTRSPHLEVAHRINEHATLHRANCIFSEIVERISTGNPISSMKGVF